MKNKTHIIRLITLFLVVTIVSLPVLLKANTNEVIVVSASQKEVKPMVTMGCVLGVIVVVGGAYVIYKLYGVCSRVLPPNPPPPPPPPPNQTNNVTKASMQLKQSDGSSSVTSVAYFPTPDQSIVGNGNLPFCVQCTLTDTPVGTNIVLNALPVDMTAFAQVQGVSLFEGTGITTTNEPGIETYYTSNGVAISQSESPITYSGNAFQKGVIKTVDGSSDPLHKVALQVSVDMVNWQDVVVFESQYSQHVFTGTYGEQTLFFRAVLRE